MMECHNCKKEYDDKDGMMNIDREKFNHGILGNRYIWLCTKCDESLDFDGRNKIWKEVHNITLPIPKLHKPKIPKLRYLLKSFIYREKGCR